jgi:hypothetical protein
MNPLCFEAKTRKARRRGLAQKGAANFSPPIYSAGLSRNKCANGQAGTVPVPWKPLCPSLLQALSGVLTAAQLAAQPLPAQSGESILLHGGDGKQTNKQKVYRQYPVILYLKCSSICVPLICHQHFG